MKNITLLFYIFLTFSILPLFAQNSEEEKFFTWMEQQQLILNNSKNTEDPKQAEELYIKFIQGFNKFSADIQKEYTFLKGTIYYQLARKYAVQGKIKKALEAFENAAKFEGAIYSDAIAEKDFDNIRQENKFQAVMASIREKSDYKYILQKAPGYTLEKTDTLPKFTYMNPNNKHLVRVREYFNLDSIAGSGNEISKIKNLLAWVHHAVPYDGISDNPKVKNAIDLITLCRKENRGLNCRMLATVLNECYLAMGFKSRIVACMPKENSFDCHIINTVYSNTLDKWIWVDPTFNAYVTDENGTLLSIAQVRESLRNNTPLLLNKEANHTKELYLDSYMCKNLYYITCMIHSEYGAESPFRKENAFIDLLPAGFTADMSSSRWHTSNEDYFWQSPY